jgi:hypothetical protein
MVESGLEEASEAAKNKKQNKNAVGLLNVGGKPALFTGRNGPGICVGCYAIALNYRHRMAGTLL